MLAFDDVLGAARNLDAVDRLRQVDALWETLASAEWPVPNAEWLAEAQRRSAEYDQGRMSASVWPDVRARARRKAGLDG